MGNPDWNTENLNPDSHFQQRAGTERFRLWAFQAPDSPGEPAGGHRGRKGRDGRAGMAVSQLPERETLASDSPCPRQSPHKPAENCFGEREVCRLVLFCFVLNLRNFALPGFWDSLSPGRLERGPQDCCRHLDGLLFLAALDLSLSKAAMCLGGWGALPIWCCSDSCQLGKVAWEGGGAVGARSPKHTQDPSKMGISSPRPSAHHLTLVPALALS